MSASAEFYTEITKLNDINLIAIFITEEHQRPHFLCLVKRNVPVMLKRNVSS